MMSLMWSERLQHQRSRKPITNSPLNGIQTMQPLMKTRRKPLLQSSRLSRRLIRYFPIRRGELPMMNLVNLKASGGGCAAGGLMRSGAGNGPTTTTVERLQVARAAVWLPFLFALVSFSF
ncbi:hypothetical protein KIN20_027956 [Parelaphostrongylus tenuis]|uniref:Uncharacterized protein n=1 Tax=Parelaphostrongylus tenuis TaxID=148309 RepID=A0AAD5WEK2_PARTN|nr:hypothetical protein KIN20_027956 [Parelaphostrongylus tenuis]